MKHPIVRRVVPALAALLVMGTVAGASDKAGPQQAHMVFFTLKDHSKEARAKFVASCHEYLSGHEGTVSFSVGVIAEDVEEPGVSVRDFDVALHLVFESKDAGKRYQESPRHQKFVAENRDSFAQVRVFDSYLTATKP
jgi:hypothetical protein